MEYAHNSHVICLEHHGHLITISCELDCVCIIVRTSISSQS